MELPQLPQATWITPPLSSPRECIVSFSIHHILSSPSLHTSVPPTGPGSSSPAKMALFALVSQHLILFSCGCPLRTLWLRMLKWFAKDIMLVWNRAGIRNQVTWLIIQYFFFNLPSDYCDLLHFIAPLVTSNTFSLISRLCCSPKVGRGFSLPLRDLWIEAVSQCLKSQRQSLKELLTCAYDLLQTTLSYGTHA